MAGSDPRGVVGAGQVASFGGGDAPPPDGPSASESQQDISLILTPRDMPPKTKQALHNQLEAIGSATTSSMVMKYFYPLLEKHLMLKAKAVTGQIGRYLGSFVLTAPLQARYVFEALVSHYGTPFVLETDIMAYLHLDKTEPDAEVDIQNQRLHRHAPDIRSLCNVLEGNWAMVNDSYITLLMFPPDKRPFLEGVLSVAEKDYGFERGIGNSLSANLGELITHAGNAFHLKTIMAYAATVNDPQVMAWHKLVQETLTIK